MIAWRKKIPQSLYAVDLLAEATPRDESTGELLSFQFPVLCTMIYDL
jgi:hypothetical protein